MMNNNIRVIGLKAGERMLSIANSIIDTDIHKIVFNYPVYPRCHHIGTYFRNLYDITDITMNLESYQDIVEAIFIHPTDNNIDMIEGAARALPDVTFYIFTQLDVFGRYSSIMMDLINYNFDNKSLPIGVGDIVQLNDVDVRAIVVSISDPSRENGSFASIMLDTGSVTSVNTNRMTKIGHSNAFIDALPSLKDDRQDVFKDE